MAHLQQLVPVPIDTHAHVHTRVNTNACVDAHIDPHDQADHAVSSVRVTRWSIRLQPTRPTRTTRLQAISCHRGATSNGARSREDKAHGDMDHGAGSPEEELCAHTDERHGH